MRTQSDVHADHEARFAEWYTLRPSKAPACPRVVAGKRCQVGNDQGLLCVCHRHRPVLDHGRMWLDEDGKHVLTGEPYDVALAGLLGLQVDLDELGLRATVTGRSPWNPGYTFLITIRAEGK